MLSVFLPNSEATFPLEINFFKWSMRSFGHLSKSFGVLEWQKIFQKLVPRKNESTYFLNTVKLDFKELLNKEQIDFKELFTDYQLFYTINLLLNKELLPI